MASLQRVSVVCGPRKVVPAAPLVTHLQHLCTNDSPALVYSDETCNVSVSYSELDSRSNSMGKAIAAHAKPVGPNGDKDYVIAVCMQPTHNTILSLLSIWKAGAAYIPLEPSFPQARISHILKDVQPALIIYDDTANPSMFTNSGVPAISFEDLTLDASAYLADGLADNEILAPATADSIAIVLYTSGSTGIPKGVRLSYSAICNRLWWQFHTFPYSETESKFVWKSALTFLDSVCEIWGPLLHGRTLLILSKETTRDPQKLVRVLDENRVERLVLVPTLLESILMYLSWSPERMLQHLKLWVCSGETLSKGLAARFLKHFGHGYRLANFYGSTEVMADVTYFVIENSAQLEMFPSIPIGVPLDNCAIYLLDDEMNPSHESEPGELWVAGHNLARGYVGGKGSEKFCDNPYAAHTDFSRLYRTGDFGILYKGMILFAGRTDSQVKIRGHRVDLQEVEKAVMGIQGVDKGVVLCYGLDRENPEILAFVTINQNAQLNGSHIENALKDALISYMIPQVIVIDSIPLLVNGKVDRQALLKMYENTNNNNDTTIYLDIDYSGVCPDDRTKAQILFETVGEVLGRAARGAISLRAGFYELGGNSLNSIYTITRLRDRGYFIEISDFIGASNLGELLQHLTTDPNSSTVEKSKFTVVPMRDSHREDVVKMVGSSFYGKSQLEQFILDEINMREYDECISACWEPLLEAELSVVLTDASDSPVAVVLNFDARAEPVIQLAGGLGKIMTFLEYVECSARDTMLPERKGAILHSFMMATASTLSAADNVAAVQALEVATMNIARERRFLGIFTTNTSLLTQQLGTDVLGFQTLLDYQINQYVDPNGDRIFGDATDDMRAIVCWKPVE